MSSGQHILNTNITSRGSGSFYFHTLPPFQTVCPHEQYRDIADPLSSALVLRTFMFQGMKDGDEMVISAKVMACVDPRDCSVVREEFQHERVLVSRLNFL